MTDKQSRVQRQLQPTDPISAAETLPPTSYSVPESLRVMRQVATGRSSLKLIPAIQHLQTTIGNRAVQRLLQQSNLLQRAPGAAPTAEAAPDATGAASENDAAVGMLDYSMVAGHIAEAFNEYDAMVIQVPDGMGGQAQIQISLAYFMNAYNDKDKTAYNALAADPLRTEEEEKIFANLQARKNRHEIHMKAFNALQKPLKEVQPEDYNTLIGEIKYGKGSALRYQTLIQTAINKAAAMKAAGKSDEEIASRVLPIPAETPAQWQTNVQSWVDKHHIGVDCSGLIDQILDQVVAEFDLKLLPIGSGQRVVNLADLRPSDVSVGPGHIRMVQNVELVTDPDDPTMNWLQVTLIESGSGVGGTNTRYLRFPTQHKGKDLLNGDIDKAIRRMQEINDSGKWVPAAAERKKYTFYRRLESKKPKAE